MDSGFACQLMFDRLVDHEFKEAYYQLADLTFAKAGNIMVCWYVSEETIQEIKIHIDVGYGLESKWSSDEIKQAWICSA